MQSSATGHRPQAGDHEAMRAWRRGRALWRAHYAVDELRRALRRSGLRDVAAAVGLALGIGTFVLLRDGRIVDATSSATDKLNEGLVRLAAALVP